jgi:hypothetical protein
VAISDRELAPQNTHRWAKVPRAVTEDIALNDGEFRTLAFLIDHGNDQGQSHYSVAQMAAMLGVSPRQQQRRLRGLVTKGRITIAAQHNPRGFQVTSRYTVLQGVTPMTPPRRLRSVSAGKQGVTSMTPKEELRSSSSVVRKQFKRPKAQSDAAALDGASRPPSAKSPGVAKLIMRTRELLAGESTWPTWIDRDRIRRSLARVESGEDPDIRWLLLDLEELERNLGA